MKPRDLANRMQDGFRRQTFTLPREAARVKAREIFDRYPRAAYGTAVEHWRALPGDQIEFTIKRTRMQSASGSAVLNERQGRQPWKLTRNGCIRQRRWLRRGP